MNETEHRSPLNNSLVDGTESSISKHRKKYVVLFDLIFPILWGISTVYSSFWSIMVNYFFMILYSIFTNKLNDFSFDSNRMPSLIIVMSLVYSSIYVALQTFFIILFKNGGSLKLPSFTKDMDLVCDSSLEDNIPIYFTHQIISIIVSLVFILLRTSIPVEWYTRAKKSVQGKISWVYRVFFLLSLSIISSVFLKKEFIFITILFYILCLMIILYHKPLSAGITKVFWMLYLVSLTIFLVFSNTKFGTAVKSTVVPNWSIVALVFFNGYMACVFLGANLGNHVSTVRLVSHQSPSVVLYLLGPYSVLIYAGLFCLFDLNWYSFSCFVLASLSSFLSTSIQRKYALFIHALITLITGIHFSLFPFFQTISKSNDTYRLVLFISSSLASLVFSNQSEHSVVKSLNNESVVSYVFSLLSIVIVYSFGISITCFSSKYPSISIGVLFAFLIIMIGFGAFNNTTWNISMLLSLIGAIIHLFNNMRSHKFVLTWLLINSNKSTSPIEDSWPFLMVFVLGVLGKQFFVPPTQAFLHLIKLIGLFIILCLILVFANNSAFSLIYFIFMVMYLFFGEQRNTFTLIIGVVSSFQIIFLQVMNYSEMQKYIGSSLIKKIFGLADINIQNQIHELSIYIIIYLLSLSIRARFYINSANLIGSNQLINRIISQSLSIIYRMSFYLFWASIFACIVTSKGITIICSVICVMLSFLKLFNYLGTKFNTFLFGLFVVVVLTQIASHMFNLHKSLSDLLELIGPDIDIPIQRLMNILVSVSAFAHGKSQSDEIPINKYISYIAQLIRKNLIVVVQVFFTVLSLYSQSSLAIVAALLMLVLLLSPMMSKGSGASISAIMTLIFAYIFTFRIVKFSQSSKYSDYFLLTKISISDLVLYFLCIFFFSLYFEFGIGEHVSFGKSFFTAHGFSIISCIIIAISFSSYDFSHLVHSILVVFIIGKSISNQKPFTKGMWYCLVLSYAEIVLKSTRLCPLVFVQSTTAIDTIFGLDSKTNVSWIAIFSLEFLLVILMKSNDYLEVQERENKRIEYRGRRQVIISEITELDTRFSQLYFSKTVNNLKADFETLLFNSTSMSSSPSQYQFNENEFESENSESIARVIIKYLIIVFVTIANWIVDFINGAMLLMTDINLEGGVSTPLFIKVKEMVTKILVDFENSNAFLMPEEYHGLYNSLPISFIKNFQVLKHFEHMKNNEQPRWSIFCHSLGVLSRQLPSIMFNCFTLLYVYYQQSIIGFVWLIITVLSISFKIDSRVYNFYYSSIVLIIRFLLSLPYISKVIYDGSFSVTENQRKVKLFVLFGIGDSKSMISYDIIILILSLLSIINSQIHPNPLYKSEGSTFIEKLFSRFSMTSPKVIPIREIVFSIDMVSFIIALFDYSDWSKSGALFNIVHGSTSVTPTFVFLLIVLFAFMVMTQVFILSQSPKYLTLGTVMGLLSIFTYVLYIIPFDSLSQCYQFTSYKVFVLTRVLSLFTIAVQLSIGFNHNPPNSRNEKPFVIYIMNQIILVVPFIFEFISVIRWIAIDTSVSLFDYITINQLRLNLESQSSSSELFPNKREKKSHKTGFIFLLIMSSLLFIPIMLMMNSQGISLPNPVKAFSISSGIIGLPDFYVRRSNPMENTITTNHLEVLSETKNENLRTFFGSPVNQMQLLSMPFSSSSSWDISDLAARDAITSNGTSFVPYIQLTLQFANSTTSNKVDTVVINRFSDPISQIEAQALIEALNFTLNPTMQGNYTIHIPKLIPSFIYVPLEKTAGYISDYLMDVSFTLTRSQRSVLSWDMKIIESSNFKIPFLFDDPKSVRMVVWSQPSFDAIISSILSTTGGILGLYAFIIITIGQFVRMWVSGLIENLWISRMADPKKLLNVIMAIEAYQIEGDLLNEYVLAQKLLENLRSKERIIKITETIPL